MNLCIHCVLYSNIMGINHVYHFQIDVALDLISIDVQINACWLIRKRNFAKQKKKQFFTEYQFMWNVVQCGMFNFTFIQMLK
jgi:hypothetical protein